ncbi:related to Probable cytosolic iron-sulfur protein assembly protein 1 [Saccharomycodes ludwigii]|uniref:Probable cytosolic iron-sulfur protein assembly protein 1 n=1 Tax=Saccharomycodes ludwigii TaxID=36035 RepID=A0A376B6C0_9ASCO|nr:hypothetical protein SCDLUD_003183 [Saccharomycodes ludwigii]KAH3900212.1 hypothetical protein SCDLUD_003183 [Saccharomycodes ludwigii]SSD60181.1 related to Probable cytosolic iron-sulfur protein assembly protein 1 [Saccharomycodes ludwigii]
MELLKSLPIHTDKIWSLAINKPHQLLATASSDRKIKFIKVGEAHDKNSYNVVDELDDSIHKKSIRTVAWRPSEYTHMPVLAAGSFDTTVSIWGKENDESILSENNNGTIELLALIEGHENEVKCCNWSHNSQYLASCSRDKTVWIWEADDYSEDFECVAVLQEHSQDVKHCVWHPHKLLLASSSYDDSIRIWREFDDGDDWECAAVLEGHEGTVWCSSFEPNSATENIRLCSSSDDGTVRIWKLIEDHDDDDEQKWNQESVLPQAHSRQVYHCDWNTNGYIASCGADGKIVVYKEEEKFSGKWSILFEKNDAHGCYEINTVKWIDDNRLATADDNGTVNIWKI